MVDILPGMIKPAWKLRGPITLFCESRRFRWTAIAIALLPVLYVIGFGPACWWLSTRYALKDGGKLFYAPQIYSPIGRFVLWSGDVKAQSAIGWYATIGVADEDAVCCGAFEIDDPGAVFYAREHR
jgi:hypothetical protein